MEYSEKWNSSAEFFYKNNDYYWMVDHLRDYHTILEIGCGTGYSTLAMLEKGHRVIAIDNNPECIAKAKELIDKNGYSNAVEFILYDFLYPQSLEDIEKRFSCDVICCWNPGQAGSGDDLTDYNQYNAILSYYDFTVIDFLQEPTNCYVETLFMICSECAKKIGVPFHIIDRGIPNAHENYDYYRGIQEKAGFSNIDFDRRNTKSLSSKGVKLVLGNKAYNQDIIDVYLMSVLLK